VTSTDWRDEKYREVFESVLRGLERQRALGAAFTLADAEGTLRHLYIQEGNDWAGRGEPQDISIAATIAAYEHFIAEWKVETPDPRPQGPADSLAKE